MADDVVALLPEAVDAVEELVVAPRHPVGLGQEDILRGEEIAPFAEDHHLAEDNFNCWIILKIINSKLLPWC